MTGRVPLARRSLFADRRRAALATVGVAAALSLVLLFDGLFAGALRQATAYQRGWQADLVVSQQGVRTMHMSASALPPATVASARAVPGVLWAEPIRYTSAVVHAGLAEQFAYVIGYDTATGRGGPRHLVAGRPPTAGEAVIDHLGAGRLHIAVGRTITVLGRSWVVSGLSSGGTSIVNTTVFVTNDDFAAQRGPAVSYILVGTQPGAGVADRHRADPGRLRPRGGQHHPGHVRRHSEDRHPDRAAHRPRRDRAHPVHAHVWPGCATTGCSRRSARRTGASPRWSPPRRRGQSPSLSPSRCSSPSPSRRS